MQAEALSTTPGVDAKVRALAKAGYPVGTIARTYQLTVEEVQELCANRAAPPLPPPPPPPTEKRSKSTARRPWDPSRVHPVEVRAEPRPPLTERSDGAAMRSLLASIDAPWPQAVTALRVSDGLLVFEYD